MGGSSCARQTCHTTIRSMRRYALNIDFVNEALGPGARVAFELSVDAARALVEAIGSVLERAEAGGYLEPPTLAAQGIYDRPV